MSEAEDQARFCWAGRWAFFGGLWDRRRPCPLPPAHQIANELMEPIQLCDPHFKQVEAAGLVTDVDIGVEAFEEREAKRRGQRRRFR